MKMYCFLVLLVLPLSPYAQTTGKIIYEEKMDMHKTLPPGQQDMRDMMPQFSTSNWELVFSGDESIYQTQKLEELEYTSNQGGAQMTMRFGRDNRVLYKNLATPEMVDSREFMQKQFLIKGPPTERKWKIGKKQKEILGYPCHEASFQADSTTHIVAWYTPKLQHPNGPSDFQGLPGLILQIDVNDGQRVTTATKIQFDSIDTSVILAPTKGKEVTADEFEKIRQEKMKEMGLQRGQPMMIIHRQ
jgi:GLPGLI family protein